MAELTPLYMDISGVYSGDELGLPYRDIMSEGVVGSGDLAVAQHAGGANLSVDVAAGAAWVLGDTNPDAQPIYRVRNDAIVNKGISPDPSNPRKVVIAAQITDATFAGATRQWAITAIHGAPAASPVEPALPDSALKLAVITVPAAATSIVTANITDSRSRATTHGGEVAYAEVNVPVTMASTNVAAPTTLVTAPQIYCDGATRIAVEFFAPYYDTSGSSVATRLALYDNGTKISDLGILQTTGGFVPVGTNKVFLTPAAGVHVFKVGGYTTSAGSPVIGAGSGGTSAGAYAPGFIQITRA